MSKIMKNIVKKFTILYNSRYGSLILYILLFILCFILIAGQDYKLHRADDKFHVLLIEKYGSPLKAMYQMYENINGRYFVSIVMTYVMDKDIWIWRILNTLMLFILTFFSAKIVQLCYGLKREQFHVVLYIIFALLCFMPADVWNWSVTWVTGSFNYLWPLAAFVIVMYYILNSYLNNKQIKWYEFMFLIPITMYATSTEQPALVFLTMVLIFTIYSAIKNKYIDKYVILLFLVGIISTYFLFTSPSMEKRYLKEITRWYPMFNELSLWTKSVLGYSYTVIYALLLHNYATTIFLCFMLYLLIKTYRNKIYNIITIVLLLYPLFYYVLGQIESSIRTSIIYNAARYGASVRFNYVDEPYISVIIGTIVLLLLIFFVLKIKWSSFERKWFAVLLFSASIVSSFILSYSPTIFASHARIFFVPYILWILFTLFLFVEAINVNRINIKSKKFIFIFILLVIFSFVDAFNKVYFNTW